MSVLAHNRMIATSLLLAAAFATSASTASAEPLNLRFDVNVSGLRVMKVEFAGDVGATSYQGQVSMRPKGFAKVFLKKKIDMQVKGRFNDNHARPASFHIRTRKKKREKTATVKWGKGLVPASWTRNPPTSAERRRQVKAAIANGAIDPLSLLFGMGRGGAANPCRGKARLFDGLTVYDMRMKLLGKDTVRSAQYSGPVLKCRLVYVPVAGMSEEKKRRSLKNPPVFTVWLARVGSAAGPLLVPVRASGLLKGRPFTATLSRGSLGGKPLRAATN